MYVKPMGAKEMLDDTNKKQVFLNITLVDAVEEQKDGEVLNIGTVVCINK